MIASVDTMWRMWSSASSVSTRERPITTGLPSADDPWRPSMTAQSSNNIIFVCRRKCHITRAVPVQSESEAGDSTRNIIVLPDHFLACFVPRHLDS